MKRNNFRFRYSCKRSLNNERADFVLKVFVKYYTDKLKMAELGPVVVVVALIALLFNFGVHKVEEGI